LYGKLIGEMILNQLNKKMMEKNLKTLVKLKKTRDTRVYLIIYMKISECQEQKNKLRNFIKKLKELHLKSKNKRERKRSLKMKQACSNKKKLMKEMNS